MSQIAIKDLEKSGEWVTEHVSLDDERKLFSVVFSGTGRTLQDGNLMTLREAIEAARSAQRGHSQDGEANEGCLAITISPSYKNDYCCFYFAGLRELHLIENRGFIFIEHWREYHEREQMPDQTVEHSKKYELTEELIIIDGYPLHRIRALKDFADVKAGDLGGFIESERNLSHEGDCWVYDDAKVYSEARVYDNAKVYEAVTISGIARVYGEAHIYNNAHVYDVARIYGEARVFGCARVSCEAQIYGNAYVHGNACVYGKAQVYGDARVYGFVILCGHSQTYDKAQVYGSALINNNVRVFGNAKVYGEAEVYESAQVFEGARIHGRSLVYGKAKVYGKADLYGEMRIFGSLKIFE